jgi:hypothetical protein
MTEMEALKQRLKETMMRDFGNVYRWFDRYSDSIESVEALEEMDEESLGYDCPPFMGIRETAEVVLETGFIDEEAA